MYRYESDHVWTYEDFVLRWRAQPNALIDGVPVELSPIVSYRSATSGWGHSSATQENVLMIIIMLAAPDIIEHFLEGKKS
jgi:hypothetical protein